MYAVFEDINAFDIWHENVKKELGIPDAFGTLNYTTAMISALENSSIVYAYVDDQIDKTNLDLHTKDSLIDLGHCEEFILPE